MSDKHSNNDNEILEGEVNVDDINNIKEEKSVSETEVWNKEEAIKEGLSEQLGRAGKRVKANLNRIKEELGVDKLNTALAELIEFYEKRPVENNGIDIKQDLVALNKGKEIIENIINSVNSKTALFESEVLGKTREVQSQIDLSIKSFVEIMEEINSKFEEKIKEQEEINSSLKVDLDEANKEIAAHKEVEDKLNKEIIKNEADIKSLEKDKEDIKEDLIAKKNELNSLNHIKEENNILNSKVTELTIENTALKGSLENDAAKIKRLEEDKKSLSDAWSKDKDALEEKKNLLADMEESLKNQTLELSKNALTIDNLLKANKQLKEDNSVLNKEVNDLKEEKYSMELSHQKELISKEKEIKDQIEKEKDEELHKLKEKYEEEIKNLMREKFELQMKVESLSNKNK